MNTTHFTQFPLPMLMHAKLRPEAIRAREIARCARTPASPADCRPPRRKAKTSETLAGLVVGHARACESEHEAAQGPRMGAWLIAFSSMSARGGARPKDREAEPHPTGYVSYMAHCGGADRPFAFRVSGI